ncbi:MAG TPA: hypothetical protein VMZ29_16235 [Candidatus Bathyarchaeia archaeon]|nr:hypothetical protein [Candidatus Bathyarchaeia archaeon]
MKIDTSKLEDFLKKKLEDDVELEMDDFMSLTPSGPPTCKIESHNMDKWLGIKALVNYNGRTMDPSTDRVSGDPEDAHAWYDWIGLAATAPKSVKHPDELNTWAHLATYYRITFRDVQYPGPFGFHSGRLLKDFTKSGIAEVYVVTEERFQDEAPVSKTKEIKIDLNKGKENEQNK